MLISFALAVAAGYFAPVAEPKIRDMIASLQMKDADLDGLELRLLTFVVLLLGAVVLSLALGLNHSALSMVLGGGVGVFGQRIWTATADLRGDLQKKIKKDDGDDPR
jgi:hypothetical protein